MKNFNIVIASVFFALVNLGMASDVKIGQFKTLIDKLVDNNKGYETPEAIKAQEDIIKMGTKAFPVLIKNIHDKRPACLCFQGQTTAETTVGDVCLDIVSAQVERYSYLGKTYPAYLTKKNINEWWKKIGTLL